MKNLVVSLFDKTGEMVRPWHEAGRMCLIVDIQHEPGLYQLEKDGIWHLGIDLRHGFKIPSQLIGKFGRIDFVSAFPPCDHLAVSGSRWFKGKGLRALSLSIELFATAAEFCEASWAPYLIENPVSTISTYWRKPDSTFEPWHYTLNEPLDNYYKKTCLWTGGGFRMPLWCIDEELGPPDCRIHVASPGADRKNFRSATPKGFAQAVFESNCKDVLTA